MKHDWELGRFKFVCCRVCLIAQNDKNKDDECKGPSHIVLKSMRYTSTAKVLNVEEKFAPDRTVGKDTDGQWLHESASLGWFITTLSNISYGVGTERPGISKGDTVRITLEKV